MIRANLARNKLNGINRNNSNVQKSWTIVQLHQFAKTFSFAIVPHAGRHILKMKLHVLFAILLKILISELPNYETFAEAGTD